MWPVSFNRSSLPEGPPQTWYEEFRAEVISDHRQLLECREARAGKSEWSFEHAVVRTQAFYRERFTGYHKTGSISQAELEELMPLVKKLGSAEFPDR